MKQGNCRVAGEGHRPNYSVNSKGGQMPTVLCGQKPKNLKPLWPLLWSRPSQAMWWQSLTPGSGVPRDDAGTPSNSTDIPGYAWYNTGNNTATLSLPLERVLEVQIQCCGFLTRLMYGKEGTCSAPEAWPLETLPPGSLGGKSKDKAVCRKKK